MATRSTHPFTCIVAGPTGCGETTFVTRILHHASAITDPPPQKLCGVMESCNTCTTRYRTWRLWTVYRRSRWSIRRRNIWWSLKPLWQKLMAESHTCMSTKNVITVIHPSSMFPKTRESRTISLNAQKIVAFKSPRDDTSCQTNVSRTRGVAYMQEAFKKALVSGCRLADDYCWMPMGNQCPPS